MIEGYVQDGGLKCFVCHERIRTLAVASPGGHRCFDCERPEDEPLQECAVRNVNCPHTEVPMPRAVASEVHHATDMESSVHNLLMAFAFLLQGSVWFALGFCFGWL